MPIGTLGLAFVAGTLSVLSPCVLPLLPIVLGTAASEHRMGPAALAAGLADWRLAPAERVALERLDLAAPATLTNYAQRALVVGALRRS